MNNDMHDFEEFMQRRAEATRAYVCGNAAVLHCLVARQHSAPADRFMCKIVAIYVSVAMSWAHGG